MLLFARVQMACNGKQASGSQDLSTETQQARESEGGIKPSGIRGGEEGISWPRSNKVGAANVPWNKS